MNRRSRHACARLVRPNAPRLVGALALCLAVLGCGDGGDGDEPRFIARDRGKLTVLADGLDFPTTVALRGDTAWVIEAQLDHLMRPVGPPPDLPFKVRSVSLDGRLAAETIDLPGDEFYPEGIAAAPNGDLYVGSLFTGEIVKIPAGSTTPVPYNTLTHGAVGLLVDPARDLLWACDSNAVGQMTTERVLLGLSLGSGYARVGHTLPPGTFCNDVLIEPDGDILFTESFAGRVYRIPSEDVLVSESAELFITSDLIEPYSPTTFGANGLAIVGGRLFVAVSSKNDLVRFDLSAPDPSATGTVVKVYDSIPLTGPDGLLRLSDRELLVVENEFGGQGFGRLSKITFDPE